MKINILQKIGSLIYLFLGFGLILIGLASDVISKNIEFGILSSGIIGDLIKISAFAAFFLFIATHWKRESIPLKRLTGILFLGVVVLGISLFLSSILGADFEAKSSLLIPLNYSAIFASNAVSVILGVGSIIILLLLRDILFYKPRKNTKRNFLLTVIILIVAALSTIDLNPYDSRTISYILYGLVILMILVNSFRLPWIVFLNKKEKVLTIVFSFLILAVFSTLKVIISSNSAVGKYLLFYSHPLLFFVDGALLFVIIYALMAFMSTIFHLPTADTFDRKMSEVASLHNLSKLVTQVFDFKELVESVTGMTLQVCEADSAWLEIIKSHSNLIDEKSKASNGFLDIQVAANNKISMEEIKYINNKNGRSLRDYIIEEKKPIVIENFIRDPKTKNIKNLKNKIGSMLVVPLISHNELSGILYAAKKIEYGFDREDIEVVSAFADQVAIAIDNSRLIEKSLERERLLREMILAQEMQKKLLPQELPKFENIEFEAFSSPAFEVGGDYYDYMMLDDRYLAVIIGDVSGKGVSAAFYMAEMKGVFQSLGKMFFSPKEFLIKANSVISSSIDKRWFISLIYAILDLETGIMTIARAGHCPYLIANGDGVQYRRPSGLGVGMGTPKLFQDFIHEEKIQLKRNDVCVFYTDGITEARPEIGEEFGYDRLLDVLKQHHRKTSMDIRDQIILSVNKYMDNEPPIDDITLLIMKWKK